MSRLIASAIRSGLKTRSVGSRVIVVDSVESTNDRAWQETLSGAPDGTVILAEHQTLGRGRFGRTWFSPPGTCVLMSAILRLDVEPSQLGLVTALGALAVTEPLEALGLKPQILFPNDVVVHGRKIAGVLVESRFVSMRADVFIVGIGLNVNVEAFPRELTATATSVQIESGLPADRTRLVRSLLESLDAWTSRLTRAPRELAREFRRRSCLLRRRAEVREAGKVFRGRVDDVDALEGITLRLDNGHMKQVRGEYVEQVRLVD